MKVLMVNTPDSPRFGGGDLLQMRKTADALRLLGVQVSESFEREPDARGFDVAHVFNLRTLHVTPRQVQSLKRSGVPVVLSPIYLNPAFPYWATQILNNVFATPHAEAELTRLLDEFRTYKLKLKRPQGITLAADAPNRPRAGYDQDQIATLAQVDYLLPNSMLEMNALVKTLRVYLPFTVVPYAVDPAIFLDPDPAPFTSKYGLRDFVLQVGRIEPSKNQLLLTYALRDLDVPVVLIGGQLHAQYLAWCRQHGGKNLTVISRLPPEELCSAYAAARLHVLPSWIETCGLVSMEAALGNCSLVVSSAGYELEYYRDLAYYCDPADVGSIRSTVQKALDNYPADALRRQRLKELILREYTWFRAAELTLHGYQQALACRSK